MVLANWGRHWLITGSRSKPSIFSVGRTRRQIRTGGFFPFSAGAPVDSRIRQNLALIVGLQDRFDEVEGIVKAESPVDEAAANVAI